MPSARQKKLPEGVMQLQCSARPRLNPPQLVHLCLPRSFSLLGTLKQGHSLLLNSPHKKPQLQHNSSPRRDQQPA